MLSSYPSFLQRIYEQWECDKVIFIGDVVDWAAISFHEKNPSLSSAEEEFYKAKKQVGRLYQIFPEATWLIGNHDCLTERQAVSVGLPTVVLRDYQDLWGVDNWEVLSRFTRLKFEKTVYCHGDSGKGGMYSAVKNSRDNFINWVCGHHHSEAGVWYTTVEGARVFGMNVGCGVNRDLLQFSYGRKFNKKPNLGCGVVIDGKQAYYEPM